MSNQTPSIGRIVHYRIQNHPDPLPAVITYTNIHNDPEDMAVGLFIMSPFVGGYTMDEVTQGDEDYQWNWPPYVPAKPRPVPTADDVELLLRNNIGSSMNDVARQIMWLFKDFLK